MQIILKTNVEKLGREGELVTVADGYARNYLIPKKLAVLATEKKSAVSWAWKKDRNWSSDKS